MAVVIDATPSGASANSYVTLADADSYFEGRSGAAGWDDSGVVDDDKNRALVTATNRLESEDYVGSIADQDQRLRWPRFGTYDEDGRLYVDTAVPRPVKEACYELADAILGETYKVSPTTSSGDLSEFEKVKVGPIEVVPASGVSTSDFDMPDVVYSLLAHLLRAGSRGLNVRIERG